MADALADITLRFSRDLSALEAECRARTDAVEAERLRSLRGVPAAGPHLTAFDQADATAAAARDKTVVLAAAACTAAEEAARTARSEALLDIDRRYIDADRAADDARRAALEKAEREYQELLNQIDHGVPLEQQRVERRKAFERYQQAVGVADRSWTEALREDRDDQQHARADALNRERRDLDEADTRRSVTEIAAAALYEQAVNAARAKLAAALNALPQAAPIEADFAARHEAINGDCRDRENRLFEALQSALAAARGDTPSNGKLA